jgi:hypothetical protein
VVALAAALPVSASASAPWGPNAATLRGAVTRIVNAELAGNGATACTILNPPLDMTVGGKTCAQRWDARIQGLLASPKATRGLRADLRAVTTAPVTIDGEHASIVLPAPLLNGHSRFYWTDDCWMLTR